MNQAHEKNKEALRRYLEDKEISANAFALKNEIDPAELYKLLRGEKRRVSIEMAARIEKGTMGKIRIKDWVD